MKKLMLILAIIFSIFTSGCMIDPEHTRKVLLSNGMKNIEITGYRFFGCGNSNSDYTFRTGFAADGMDGKRITGTVCSGLIFKNSSIKID